MSRQRFLVAFDFDHTIVEENSDIVARKLIHIDLIPENVRRLYQTRGWIDYMCEIFKLLHQHDVSQDTIVTAMHSMAPTPDMSELLKWLYCSGQETIIISDSNSVFIHEWLQHKKLHNFVKTVFTNPASFDDNGLLTVSPYHDQDWCTLSTKNLCKGYILETYVKERQGEGVNFESIAYVGDGHNDFCPTLKLGQNDFVFPRAGFTLDSMLQDPSQDKKAMARVCPWNSAVEIKNVLQDSL